MSRHTVLRFWEAALPGELCELIIAEGAREETQRAGLQPDEGEKYIDESIRKTNVIFWDANHWISGITMHYAQQANSEIWQYQTNLSQGTQFAHYDEGGTYDWHKDEFDQPFGDESPHSWQGKSRKLSVSVNLSNPDDYEGGDIRFKDTYGTEIDDPEMLAKIRQRGSVIVFPSYVLHTVTPVSSGKRYSLVSWIIGPPFS
jgi:PKHD-type hydroxylase